MTAWGNAWGASWGDSWGAIPGRKGDGGQTGEARQAGIRRPLRRFEAAEIFGRNQVEAGQVDLIPVQATFGQPDHRSQKIIPPDDLTGRADEDEAIAMILVMVT